MKKIIPISLTALMLCQASIASANDLVAINAQQMQTLGITVTSLVAASPVMSKQLPGEIVIPVDQEHVVSTPQSGLVDALYVTAGQSVKRGQTIGRIHSAELVALQRDYLRGRTQHQLSKNMLDRDRELYKDGIIAERRVLSTESGHQELSVEVKQRRQALSMAGMGDGAISKLEMHGELSSGLMLSSPIDGVVIEQMAAVGQRVDVSMPVYRIARLKPLWLEIHAPLDILHFVKQGMSVNIPKYQASGKITTIIRSVNRNDQTVHLRAEITVGVDKLSPGQFVEVELLGEGDATHYAVPKTSLVRNGKNGYVFVQAAKGFIATPVIVVSEQAEQVIIRGGLTGKEKVAVRGTATIKAAWYSSLAQ